MSSVLLVNTGPTRQAAELDELDELDKKVRRYFDALEARGPKLGDTRAEPNNGLLIIGRCLRHEGHEVGYLDLSALEYRRLCRDGRCFTRDEAQAELDEAAERFAFVFFSSTLVGLDGTLAAISDLKRRFPEKVTVLGGTAATLVPDYCLARCAELDALVLGEGEELAGALVRCFERGERSALGAARGVAFREGPGRPDVRRPGLNEVDLDRLGPLAFPDWSLLDPDLGPHAHRVMTARGCGFRCTYCVPSALCGHTVRPHPLDAVLGALERAVVERGASSFVIGDLTFLYDEAHGRRVLRGIVERGLARPFWCQTHLSRVTEANLALLAAAGCAQLAVGIESMDPETLRAVGKGIDPQQVAEKLALIKRHGIETQAYFIIGFPDDDAETIGRNRDFIVSAVRWGLVDRTHVGLFMPYPGLEGSPAVGPGGVEPSSFTQGVFRDLPAPRAFATRRLSSAQVREAFADCLGAIAEAFEGRQLSGPPLSSVGSRAA